MSLFRDFKTALGEKIAESFRKDGVSRPFSADAFADKILLNEYYYQQLPVDVRFRKVLSELETTTLTTRRVSTMKTDAAAQKAFNRWQWLPSRPTNLDAVIEAHADDPEVVAVLEGIREEGAFYERLKNSGEDQVTAFRKLARIWVAKCELQRVVVLDPDHEEPHAAGPMDPCPSLYGLSIWDDDDDHETALADTFRTLLVQDNLNRHLAEEWSYSVESNNINCRRYLANQLRDAYLQGVSAPTLRARALRDLDKSVPELYKNYPGEFPLYVEMRAQNLCNYYLCSVFGLGLLESANDGAGTVSVEAVGPANVRANRAWSGQLALRLLENGGTRELRQVRLEEGTIARVGRMGPGSFVDIRNAVSTFNDECDFNQLLEDCIRNAAFAYLEGGKEGLAANEHLLFGIKGRSFTYSSECADDVFLGNGDADAIVSSLEEDFSQRLYAAIGSYLATQDGEAVLYFGEQRKKGPQSLRKVLEKLADEFSRDARFDHSAPPNAHHPYTLKAFKVALLNSLGGFCRLAASRMSNKLESHVNDYLSEDSSVFEMIAPKSLWEGVAESEHAFMSANAFSEADARTHAKNAAMEQIDAMESTLITIGDEYPNLSRRHFELSFNLGSHSVVITNFSKNGTVVVAGDGTTRILLPEGREEKGRMYARILAETLSSTPSVQTDEETALLPGDKIMILGGGSSSLCFMVDSVVV